MNHYSRHVRTPIAVVVGTGSNPLGAIRSLHRVKIPTVIVTGSKNDPAFHSRYPLHRIVVPKSDNRDATLLSVLESLPYDRPVLIPTNDYLVSLVVRNSERLSSRFDFCTPEPDLAETLLDKARETELVRKSGVPIPKTFLNLDSMYPDMRETVQFPIMIKPKTTWYAKRFGAKNRVVRSPEELCAILKTHEDMLDCLLIQEVIPGDDSQQWVCNCTFSRSHELISAFVFRRLHLSPAHRGVTTYAISESNQQVLSLVASLGRELQYVGPAMVEFKFDHRDKLYKYLEINPRIGLCNFFDTTCGVNNVYQTYRLAAGESVESGHLGQRDGVMYLSLASDLYARFEDGEQLTSILYEYLSNAWRPHVGPYFSLADGHPALTTGAALLGMLTHGLWKAAMRRFTTNNRNH
ncbi:MAG: hypothetical protein JXM70_11060 [Pirellulales bacterium]|nr:hypothetical protein [Pirellulales bacterium]